MEVRTDAPGQRFAAGSVLGTDPAAAGPLTVQSVRWHTRNVLIRFAGLADRDQAEVLRGVWLTVDAADVLPSADEDEFYDHQLIGLTVVTVTGEPVGTVTDVLHHGQNLLVVTPASMAAGTGAEPRTDSAGAQRRREVFVPFVAAIAVRVDLAEGKLVIDPPPGLLELGEEERTQARRERPRRSRAKRVQAKPEGAEPGGAEPGETESGRAEPGQAESAAARAQVAEPGRAP